MKSAVGEVLFHESDSQMLAHCKKKHEGGFNQAWLPQLQYKGQLIFYTKV